MRKHHKLKFVFLMLFANAILLLSCKSIPQHCPEFSIKTISISHKMFEITFFDDYGRVEICSHYQFCKKVTPRINIPQVGSFQGEYIKMEDSDQHETCMQFSWDETNFHAVVINWNEANIELAQAAQNWRH